MSFLSGYRLRRSTYFLRYRQQLVLWWLCQCFLVLVILYKSLTRMLLAWSLLKWVLSFCSNGYLLGFYFFPWETIIQFCPVCTKSMPLNPFFCSDFHCFRQCLLASHLMVF